MTLSEKILSRVFPLAVGLLTTLVTRRVVSVVWRVVTGQKPPAADDPEVTPAQARAWAISSAVGLAAARQLVRRTGIGSANG